MAAGSVRDLFGGSMRIFIPPEAKDVSEIREVPDNQEVFCHPSTDQSIMIDILEYQEHVQNEEAIKYHFEDIAQCNQSLNAFEVARTESISIDKLSLKQCSCAWRLKGKQFVSKFNEEEEAKNIIEISIALLRLPQYSTDILVVFNNPITISPQSSSCGSSEGASSWTEETFYFCVTSLSLENPDLLSG